MSSFYQIPILEQTLSIVVKGKKITRFIERNGLYANYIWDYFFNINGRLFLP